MLHNSTPSFRLLLVAMAKFGGVLLGYSAYTVLPLPRARSWSLESCEGLIALLVAILGCLSALAFAGGFLLRRPLEPRATPQCLGPYHSRAQAGRFRARDVPRAWDNATRGNRLRAP